MRGTAPIGRIARALLVDGRDRSREHGTTADEIFHVTAVGAGADGKM